MNNIKNNEEQSDLFYCLIDIMFKAKLINLKPYILINQDFSKYNTENFLCFLNLNLKNKENLILFFTFEDSVDPNCYKKIFKKLININLNGINCEDIQLNWRNQFLVSELLDLYSGGWIENIPKNWKSMNNNYSFEIDINKKIIDEINIFYSKLEKGAVDLNEKKIQYLLL